MPSPKQVERPVLRPDADCSGGKTCHIRDPQPALSGLRVSFLAGTLGQGGAERQLFYTVRALQQSKAEVRVLSLGRNEFWEHRILELGVPVTWVGHSESKLGRLCKIFVELRRDPPQIFQSQHFYTNSYVAASAWPLRSGSIGALRSNGFMEAQDCGPIGGWLNLHTPRVLAANSQAALNYALGRNLPPSRLFLLPGVVDTEQLRSAGPRRGGPLRLLAVGRLVRAKRFDRFLGLLAGLRRELDQELEGIIVGAGPLQTELEGQAVALGLLPPALEFRGSATEIGPLYQEADIFVMTSDYEGTPNVLLEAMAVGLPVVATRVGGVAEIVLDGENGFLVEPDDMNGLSRAVNQLVSNPEVRARFGQRARAYVENHHSLACLPGRLSQLYALALCGKRRVAHFPPRSPGHQQLLPHHRPRAMSRR
jgi:glycosyltransferase involved in cell wall biosynthesis